MRPVSTKAESDSIFAVAVAVVVVGGAVGGLDGEEGDGGGDEIDGGVGGLGQHAERAGEEPGDELEQGDDGGGAHGERGRRSAWPRGVWTAWRGAVVAIQRLGYRLRRLAYRVTVQALGLVAR